MIQKVIVFDLDETLGYFTQLGVLFDTIELFTSKEIEFSLFCKLFDLYNEVFRVNIFCILNYLKRIKKTGKIKVMVYTNNQAEKSWCLNIVKYIEQKISYKLFDHVIHAYKIGNKRIEQCRTSHDKKYSDLIKCGNLHIGSKVCFIDDQFHRHMKHKNVHYINVKPYTFKIQNSEFFDKFFKSDVFTEIIKTYEIKKEDHFKTFIQNHFKNMNFITERGEGELQANKILTKKIMYHVQKFISKRIITKKKQNKTKRSKKKTQKHKE